MARPRWKKMAITALKSAVALVVLWAVGRHVLRTWNDLRDRSISLHFEPGWLIGSGLLYLAGLSAFGRFYERILDASSTPVPLLPALRAYLVSHLGKYVPGKAMVVVIRTGMVVPFGARASTAAIATFYETLVMMAAGGLIAAVGFATAVGSHPLEINLPVWGRVECPVYRLAALAGLGSGLAFLVLVLPPVFARLAGLVSLPIPGVGPEAMPRLTGRLLVQGLLWSSAGWVLLGLSQIAVVRAFDPEGARTLVALGLSARGDRQRGAGHGRGIFGGRASRRSGSARGGVDVGAGPRAGFGSIGGRGLDAPVGLGGRRAGGRGRPGPLVSTSAGRGDPSSGFGGRFRFLMISVVVPVRDEEESLATLHGELAAVFATLGPEPVPVEFIFVDDGSRDGTWGALLALARLDPTRVSAIRFRRNFGKAAALIAAFQQARGDLVFTLDGDLQDDPREIPLFLAQLETGYDVVSGWKKTRHDPWHKVYPSRVFNWMVSRLTGCHLHDHNCGFKLYRRQVLREIDIYGELHRFIPVLAYARGFKVGEVEVRHRRRRHGASKYGFSRFIKGFLDLLTVRFLTRFSQRPIHILGGIGLVLFAPGKPGHALSGHTLARSEATSRSAIARCCCTRSPT